MLFILDDEDASDYVRGAKQKPSEEPTQIKNETSTAFKARQDQWKEEIKEYNRQNKKARRKIGPLVEDGPFKSISKTSTNALTRGTSSRISTAFATSLFSICTSAKCLTADLRTARI
jgi:ElaB/YqjD/DUF883 family membrane-anchored ribosome-binding protein